MARLFGITTSTITLTLAGTPQALGAATVTPTGFELYAPTTNVGANMYVTISTAGGARRTIPRGTSWSPPDTQLVGTSGMYDLSQVFIDGDTTSDTLILTRTTITRDTD